MNLVAYLGIAFILWVAVLVAVFLGTLGALRTFFDETDLSESGDS